MKPSRTHYIKLLQALTCLLPAGPLMFMTGLPRPGTALFAVGVVALGLLQQATDTPARNLPSDKRIQVKRLGVQSALAIVSLAVSAALMGMQTWDTTRQTRQFPWAHHNEWFVFFLIGALILLYTSLRLEYIRRHLPLTIALLAIGSAGCSGPNLMQHYELKGYTNISGMESRTLTLRVFADSTLVDIDSARVTHGKFTFQGTIDSAVMANLFAENRYIIPIVLEEGELTMRLYEDDQTVGGTPMNDTLNNFIRRKTQLDNQILELDNRATRLILEGYDVDDVAVQLNKEFEMLQEEHDSMAVNFIRHNHTTPLGPGIFMIMTCRLPFPTLLHPRIEEVMRGAPAKFTSNSYVNWYMKRARANDEIIRQSRENR